MLMKALHKLFFGPSRIDDDASFDGKLMMMVNSDELLMTKTSSDVKLRTSCCCHCWNRTGGRQED
uniref:Uncharacterized protein n=1 Tax=Oryza nivara TaxID=4536 RepID=A0A0E0HTI0_ORYNI